MQNEQAKIVTKNHSLGGGANHIINYQQESKQEQEVLMVSSCKYY